MIAIGLSPNTDKKDLLEALKVLTMPWKWVKGKEVSLVKDWFKKYLSNETLVLTNSGRSALLVLLKTYGITHGDEVIIQAFTCLAVAEVIQWVGATPVFVDIDDSINIDYRKLEKSITPKTKAIIVQHTFGIPADIDPIKEIAQKNNIILIEDCAHALGATYKGKKVGTIGDASFFSFGRDKVISSVFGGLAVLNNTPKTIELLPNLEKIKKELENASLFWIFQQVLHPIIAELSLKLYNFSIGKAILVLSQRLHLLSFPIYKEEKEGKMPHVFPKLYPNALACLLLIQLEKLEDLNNHRRKLAEIYSEKLKNKKNIRLPKIINGGIYLRYNIEVEDAEKLRQKAKRHGFLLGNWYHDVIDPKGSRKIVGYKMSMCPKAERSAARSVNLPTHKKMRREDVDTVLKIILED